MKREAAAPTSAHPSTPGVGARLDGLVIRSGELIAVIAGVLSLSILLWNHERVDDWQAAAVVYALVAVGPVALRALQTRFPESQIIRVLADFSPIAYILALYLNLNPILDAVNIPIADAWLVRLDQQIFGVQLSIWMDQNFPPLLNDVLLGAYTTYFFWPAALGLLLWLRGRESEFDEWVTALMFFYAVNYAMYAIVPAMGPRYFQAAHFDGPVPGLFIASQIDLMFQGSPLARDCFPSGHTGISLLVLAYSWRHERRFFWFALPVLICLILGTLAGRFHYGIDLLAAVPLTAISLGVAAVLRRRVPAGFNVSRAQMAASFRRLLATARD